MSRGNNPYAAGANGYSGPSSNTANPYAAGGGGGGGGGGYNDPYPQQNQSSASANSYASREARGTAPRRRSNPYAQDNSPGPRPSSRGTGDAPPRRVGGYGGLPSGPAPARRQEPEYDPYNSSAPGGYESSRERERRPSAPREQREQPSQEHGRHGSAPTEEPRPRSSGRNRYGSADAEEARPQSRGQNRYDSSRSRERGQARPQDRYQQQQQQPPVPRSTGVTNGYGTSTTAAAPSYNDYSRRRPTKGMDDILRHIQGNWKTMEGDECVPVKIALQLMDQSSLGLADKEEDFSDTHVDLQKCLKGVVNEHYADFNSAVGTYHKIQNAIRESQSRVRMLKGGLMNVRGGMLTTRPELRGLAETSGQLDDMVGMLATIEELKTVSTRLEERISEKKFLSAVDLLLGSLRGLRRGELESIAALSDMRSYFANQESSLVDILCEELHDHLYLKSPYCAERWKKKSDRVESDDQPKEVMNEGNAWDRPVYHFLSNLDTSEAMIEDASKNPESDTFYYIHMILESLNKLGHLEEAIQRVEHRMPVELYRVVDKTNNEVDSRYPTHMRGQLKKDKRSVMSTRVDDGRSQVLDDFLCTLFAKFEAIAEGHRVVHDVVTGIVARDGISTPEKLIGGFKELWKLYQMEIRSILHDYLATDGDSGQRAATTAANIDVFARQQRDRNKKMFKLSEMDEKALGIKAETDELDDILKTSVPGLVNKSRAKGLNSTSDRNGNDNTSAGHKLLIEPGVFNMTVLLPPSLAFLQHLKDIVPQTAHIPMSTLTSFLDDFLINIFHPQLEEAVTELCTQCMIDIEAFSEDTMWSKHSPHPIFKGTITFLSLMRSFSDMLSSIPQDQMFTQLIINQLVTYYDKCFSFYRAIVSRVAGTDNNNALTLKAAAQFAASGETHDVALELLQASNSNSSSPDLVTKEVSTFLSSNKSNPISSFDIISDPKSIHQLSLLYNSMQWLASALTQLRHVETTTSKKSHSRNTSKTDHIRRWTLIKSLKTPGAAHTGPAIFLPLTTETAIPFDHILLSFRTLATTSLLTLHLDIRCLIIYSLSRILRGPELGGDNPTSSPINRIDSSALPPLSSGAYPFVLPSPPSSASPLILQLNNDLISFDASIASFLGIRERRFIVTGLAKLVDKYMVVGADNILVMNANGAERMRVDAMVVQQNLRGIAAVVSEHGQALKLPAEKGLGIIRSSGTRSGKETDDEDDGRLASTHQYYTLFLDGPDEVIGFLKQRKAKSEQTGYTYDELRTLIELCFSEKLRGEDREESVKARKRSGEVLLGLGELVWDS